jgi:hypothetical protein
MRRQTARSGSRAAALQTGEPVRVKVGAVEVEGRITELVKSVLHVGSGGACFEEALSAIAPPGASGSISASCSGAA